MSPISPSAQNELKAFQGIGKDNGEYRRKAFMETCKQAFYDCFDLIERKNSDYTKLKSSDPFHNFRDSGIQSFFDLNKVKATADSVTLNLLYRIGEKRKRLLNVLLTGERLVFDETIEDTIKDLINYSALLLTYLRMNGRNKSHEVAYVEKPEEVRQLEELKHLYQENKELHNRRQVLEARLLELELQVADSTKKHSAPRKLPKAVK